MLGGCTPISPDSSASRRRSCRARSARGRASPCRPRCPRGPRAAGPRDRRDDGSRGGRPARRGFPGHRRGNFGRVKLLVLATEPVDADRVRGALPDDDLEGAEVLVVSPAVNESAVAFWMSDSDEAIADAESAARATAAQLRSGARTRARRPARASRCSPCRTRSRRSTPTASSSSSATRTPRATARTTSSARPSAGSACRSPKSRR